MLVFSFAVAILFTSCVCYARKHDKHDNLSSWSNVLSFKLTPTDDSQSFTGILTTDKDEVGTIRLSLTLLPTYTYNAAKEAPSSSRCLYKGHVVYTKNGNDKVDLDSPVRLRFCEDELQGFLNLNGQTFYVDYEQAKKHTILYSQQNFREKSLVVEERCGVVERSSEKREMESELTVGARSPGETTEEKPERFYKIQVTVNHEFGYYEGVDRNRTNQQIVDRVNRIMDLANLIFSTLKKVTLHLVVADIEIFTKETDPVPEGETSLKALKKWRKETRKTQPESDALLNFVAKGRDMRGNAGLAYVGTVCTNQAVCWMADNWERSEMNSASVAVHELMHVLGFHHISRNMSDPCGCHYKDCVMRGSVTPFADYSFFTGCQENKLLEKFIKSKYDCLKTKPDVPLYEPYCGDGVINQDWEECDCHGNCDNKCCTDECNLRLDGDVCFKNGTHQSTCTENKCLANCNIDEVCCDSSTRFAKPEGAPCDHLGTFEDSCGSGKCDGVTTGRCPNLEKKNGDNCLLHGFNGQCYEGNCLSFEIQCASIFGASVVRRDMPDECLKKNTEGTEYGNCGYKESSEGNELTFTACSSSYRKYRCGKLFCSLNSTDPEPLIQIRTAEEITLYPFDIEHHKCYSVSSIMTSEGVDLSYTKNGTPCNPEGSDKFCMNGKCKPKKNIKHFN
ncbi:zinc metalloproteinase-disintegrin-like isoform X1 [Convolutriloba macropyga]|uniref:zinc metalloproteinase-disintegrin-like isoform X1 n=1 Tax=Convolutriloba macropyga TaxID=536237 RepID=UPI003F51D4EE